MIGAISSALTGLTSATKKVESSAANIANAGNPAEEVDIASEIVNMKVAENEFKANLSVLRTTNEMTAELGRLFDKKV